MLLYVRVVLKKKNPSLNMYCISSLEYAKTLFNFLLSNGNVLIPLFHVPRGTREDREERVLIKWSPVSERRKQLQGNV